VASDARPKRFSAIYPAEGVRLLIEVKQSGVFARRDELQSKLERVYKDFQAVSTEHEHISWLYLTVREVTRPKKPRSIDFLARTRDVLGNDRVACLRDSRTPDLLPGEWDRAVDLVVRAEAGWLAHSLELAAQAAGRPPHLGGYRYLEHYVFVLRNVPTLFSQGVQV
jgi:hypothetical protein